MKLEIVGEITHIEIIAQGNGIRYEAHGIGKVKFKVKEWL